MKFKTFFKDLFNFKKNKNKDKSNDQEFNVAPKQKHVSAPIKITTIVRALFFFLIAVVPLGIYAYVIYHSSGFKIYKNYGNPGSHLWNFMNLPNANNIVILFWVGIAILIVTALMICSFGIVNKYLYDKKIKTGIVFSIIIFAVIGILLASLSQYYYAKFFEFYRYESIGTAAHMQSWAVGISDALTKDKSNTKGIYTWMNASVVWWVMFVQFMILFGVGITLQNALNSSDNLNDYEKYISDKKQEDAGVSFSRVNRFFGNIFKVGDKNVAGFLIISAVVIVIPNFVYSIISTVDTTHIQSLTSWGYQIPSLIKDIDLTKYTDQPQAVSQINSIVGSLKSSRYGNAFIVASLPIIFEGLTIATVFFFIAMLLRGKNVSNRIFIIEAGVLLVEAIALVSVAFASKVYVHRLADFWDKTNGDKTNIAVFADSIKSILGPLFDKTNGGLTSMYPLNGINTVSHIHVEWLSMDATIAEVIIAFAWIFGTFTLIGNNMYQLGYFKKSKKVTYYSGIFNS